MHLQLYLWSLEQLCSVKYAKRLLSGPARLNLRSAVCRLTVCRKLFMCEHEETLKQRECCDASTLPRSAMLNHTLSALLENHTSTFPRWLCDIMMFNVCFPTFPPPSAVMLALDTCCAAQSMQSHTTFPSNADPIRSPKVWQAVFATATNSVIKCAGPHTELYGAVRVC